MTLRRDDDSPRIAFECDNRFPQDRVSYGILSDGVAERRSYSLQARESRRRGVGYCSR